MTPRMETQSLVPLYHWSASDLWATWSSPSRPQHCCSTIQGSGASGSGPLRWTRVSPPGLVFLGWSWWEWPWPLCRTHPSCTGSDTWCCKTEAAPHRRQSPGTLWCGGRACTSCTPAVQARETVKSYLSDMWKGKHKWLVCRRNGNIKYGIFYMTVLWKVALFTKLAKDFTNVDIFIFFTLKEVYGQGVTAIHTDFVNLATSNN